MHSSSSPMPTSRLVSCLLRYRNEQVSGSSPLVGSLALPASECNLGSGIRPYVDDSLDDNVNGIRRERANYHSLRKRRFGLFMGLFRTWRYAAIYATAHS